MSMSRNEVEGFAIVAATTAAIVALGLGLIAANALPDDAAPGTALGVFLVVAPVAWAVLAIAWALALRAMLRWMQ